MHVHVVSRSLMGLVLVAACLFSVRTQAGVLPSSDQSQMQSSTKSYREWKNSKISEVEVKIKSLKEKLGLQRSFAADPNLLLKDSKTSEGGLAEDLKNQLDREMLNLSLARDLTISDYFVGYLTKQNSLDLAIKDVSGRLSSEEVAELMAAYAQNFFQTKPNAVKSSPSADSGL